MIQYDMDMQTNIQTNKQICILVSLPVIVELHIHIKIFVKFKHTYTFYIRLTYTIYTTIHVLHYIIHE